MTSPKKIVIIAGEESGDMHAAELCQKLLQKDPSLQISGLGGRHLAAAGVELIENITQYGSTGLSEILRHLRFLKKAYDNIKKYLQKNRPDLLILVDYPEFNLRLAKYAKKVLGLHIVYYISPQVWAWKAKRVEIIKAYIDRMAVILPFEKTFYHQAGVPATFVGHPLSKKIPHYPDLHLIKQQLNLPTDKKIIALLPGSRRNEIIHHMPVLVDTMLALNRLRTDLHFVIPRAKTLTPSQVNAYLPENLSNITCLEGQSIPAAACSDCVIVASGTASLETALLQKPMCIIYKGATLSYLIAMKVIRVKYFGLCNLLMNKMVAPELLQYDLNEHELTKMVQFLLNDSTFATRMKRQLNELHQSLTENAADLTIEDLVEQELYVKGVNKDSERSIPSI